MWLARVREMQSVLSLFRSDGAEAVVYLGFPVVAALSAALVARNGMTTPFGWALIVAFAISAMIMCTQIRMLIYVMWLGLAFVGVAVQRLAERTSRVLVTRVLAAVLASPPAVSIGVMALAAQVAHTEGAAARDPNAEGCFRPEDYRTLAGLPAGLVFGPIDLGPGILAHTPHSVVAAPYHRADSAVRFNEEVMAGSSAEAEARIVARGTDYVVACPTSNPGSTSNSFNAALVAGRVGAWLAPIPGSASDRLKIWRVVR